MGDGCTQGALARAQVQYAPEMELGYDMLGGMTPGRMTPGRSPGMTPSRMSPSSAPPPPPCSLIIHFCHAGLCRSTLGTPSSATLHSVAAQG